MKTLHEHNNDNITSASININVAHGLKLKLLTNDVGRYAFNNKLVIYTFLYKKLKKFKLIFKQCNFSTALCDLQPKNLKEFGVYNLTLYENGTCNWLDDKKGVDVNLCGFIFNLTLKFFLFNFLFSALLSVFILVALVLCVLKITLCAWHSYRYEEVLVNAASNEASLAPPIIQQRNRMRSLDAFRG